MEDNTSFVKIKNFRDLAASLARAAHAPIYPPKVRALVEREVPMIYMIHIILTCTYLILIILIV